MSAGGEQLLALTMNPPQETPESAVNGQTRSIQQTGSAAVRSKPSRPKKGVDETAKTGITKLSFYIDSAPELPALERRNWLIHLHYIRKEYEVLLATAV